MVVSAIAEERPGAAKQGGEESQTLHRSGHIPGARLFQGN
jgi:hypothetical protein